MPRVIDMPDRQSCDLGDCVEALMASGFEPNEEESLLHAAHWLGRLGENPAFLGDMLVAELRDGIKAAEEASDYGPQVVMLSPLGHDFYMRANFCLLYTSPSPRD